jgi:hypothetical protein
MGKGNSGDRRMGRGRVKGEGMDKGKSGERGRGMGRVEKRGGQGEE